jgi:FixJ family two-component response regulator
MKRGAMDFLCKKDLDPKVLIKAVQTAIAKNRADVDLRARGDELRELLLNLTAREWDVLSLALAGKSSKEIARELQISLRTIEGHRARILLKTRVTSLLDLVQRATGAGVSLARPAQPGQLTDE